MGGALVLPGLPARRSAWSPASLSPVVEMAKFDPAYLTMMQSHAGAVSWTQNQEVGLALDRSAGMALGPELIGPSAWIPADGWVYVDGVATSSGSGNGRTMQQQLSITLALSDVYQVGWSLLSTSGTGSMILGMYLGGSGLVTVSIPSTMGSMRGYSYVTDVRPTSIRLVTNGTRNLQISDMSIRRVAGHHAAQSVSAARPTLRKTGGGVWYLEDDGVDDALTVTLPAGTYSRAHVDSAGVVTFEDGVSISGADNILRTPTLAGIVYIDRPAFTVGEKAMLAAWWGANL
jgi:hypothetical protein